MDPVGKVPLLRELENMGGHGFACTIFQGFDSSLLLKRYRCPTCGCIIKLRPSTHFSRFQSSKHTIRLNFQINATSEALIDPEPITGTWMTIFSLPGSHALI